MNTLPGMENHAADIRVQLASYVPACEQEAVELKLITGYMAAYPDSVFQRGYPAHFTASGLVLSPDMHKVLLVYHTIYNAWTWPGGHGDGETDLLSAAMREVREETGIRHVIPFSPNIAALDILPVAGHWKNGQYIAAHLHLSVGYGLIANDDQALRVKKDENKGVKWINLSDMDAYASERHMQPVYHKVLRFMGITGV